jgi:HEAT repeat protein
MSSFLESVASEFSAFLTTPAEVLVDPSQGIGSPLVANSLTEKADLLYDETAREFQSIPAEESIKALQEIDSAGQSSTTKLWITGLLVSFGDESDLPSMESVLMAPPAESPQAIQNLARAIAGSVKDPGSEQTIIDLTTSTSIQIRRAAITSLQRYARDPDPRRRKTILKTLAAALEDQDQSVRYSAVSSLALSTMQPQKLPTAKTFQRNEGEHITYWKN